MTDFQLNMIMFPTWWILCFWMGMNIPWRNNQWQFWVSLVVVTMCGYAAMELIRYVLVP